MDLEDDDEFGDLYTDVLRPIPGASTPPPPPASAKTFPAAVPAPLPLTAAASLSQSEVEARDQPGVPGATRESSGGLQTTFVEGNKADREEDWILGPAPIPEEPALDWDDDDDAAGSSAVAFHEIPKIAAREKEAAVDVVAPTAGGTAKLEIGAAAVSIPPEAKDMPSLSGEPIGRMEIEDGIGDLDAEQAIPGLAAAPLSDAFHRSNDENSRVSKSDEWDSDSEDDLQIVLNDDNLGRLGMAPTGSDDDEDGDDLVIVADDAQHLHHQVVEEQDWGDESMQPGLDGAKEVSDVAKGTLGVGAASGTRAGYGHGFHPQHHSQFKYVRPGAANLPGGAVVGIMGGTAQLRPPLSAGLVVGRGRGIQRGYHSGYGTGWAGNSLTRPFGGGLEFTLPSHKTVFDVNIDAFEEKPWTHPVVDVTDFFNFGLDEDSWKDYCKQLEQLRLEATMQTKIRVYESGRSEQDYDPDLPPELAAATGVQEVPAENTQPGRVVSGQPDMFSHEIGAVQRRAQLPTGRAIQVETGYGERLPSMDTRPPRMRDSDAIIEIVLQDFEDNSMKTHAASEHPGKDSRGSDNQGDYKSEINGHDDSEDTKRHPSHKSRTVATSEAPSSESHEGSLPEKTDVSPSSLQCQSENNHHFVKVKSTVSSGEVSRKPHDGRLGPRTPLSECSNDAIPSKNIEPETLSGANNTEFHKTPDVSPTVTDENERNPGLESADEHGDTLALGDTDVDDEELASVHLSGDTYDNNDSPSSVTKLKLSSRVEQLVCLENNDADDLRKTNSNNSRRQDEKDYGKRIEGGEDEVIQSSRARPGNIRKRHTDDVISRGSRGDHGQNSRQESNKREEFNHTRQHNEADTSSAFAGKLDNLERLKGRDASGVWLKKDDDVPGLRIKEKDNRRDRIEDVGSRHKPKHRLGDRKERDGDIPFRKGVDNGEQRSRLGRDVAGKNRDRDDSFMKHSENFTDIHPKRRKVEEHHKRDHVPKEGIHSYRSREESSQDKRGGNDSTDHLSKDEPARARDKMVSLHSSRHREDGLRHSDKGDRQRVQQFHEDSHARREREDRSGARDSRLEKPLSGNIKAKDDRKASDIDSLSKDRRRQGHNKRNHIEEKARPQHRAREETHASDTHSTRDEKRSRHGRQGGQNSRALSSSDSQNIHKRKMKENFRKNKDPDSDQNSLIIGKRKHEDNGHKDEKCSNHADGKPEMTQELHTKSNEEAASDDENQQDSRRGRSKLERWTSHRERDYNSGSIPSMASFKDREIVDNSSDVVTLLELMVEGDKSTNLDNKEFGTSSSMDKEGRDRHLETVEKLKKRSERFNLPMPGEKECTSNKKNENELLTARNESPAADLEVKQERPARKRRWVSG